MTVGTGSAHAGLSGRPETDNNDSSAAAEQHRPAETETEILRGGPEMLQIISGLGKWGADPSSAIRRVAGDISFYSTLLWQMYDSTEVGDVFLLICQEEYEDAFYSAHSLKGAAAYLSLHPLTDALSGLVETLRRLKESPKGKGQDEELAFYMERVRCEWNMFGKIMDNEVLQ